MAQRQEQLEAATCGVPGCTKEHGPMYLHGKCHPREAVEVFYTKGTGVLTVACVVCQKTVTEIEVAS